MSSVKSPDFTQDLSSCTGCKIIGWYTHSMDTEVRRSVGKKLRVARERKQLTQVEVAAKADIADGYYARIERGEENPSLEVLQKLIKALSIKSSEILPF